MPTRPLDSGQCIPWMHWPAVLAPTDLKQSKLARVKTFSARHKRITSGPLSEMKRRFVNRQVPSNAWANGKFRLISKPAPSQQLVCDAKNNHQLPQLHPCNDELHDDGSLVRFSNMRPDCAIKFRFQKGCAGVQYLRQQTICSFVSANIKFKAADCITLRRWRGAPSLHF